MKTLLLVFSVYLVGFMGCQKEGKNEGKNEKSEVKCPVIAASLVPQAVKDAFAVKYPGTSVTTWFNKDNTSICAHFLSGGVDKTAEFSNTGTFISEETDNEQEGKHEDSTRTGGKLKPGCECETGKDND